MEGHVLHAVRNRCIYDEIKNRYWAVRDVRGIKEDAREAPGESGTRKGVPGNSKREELLGTREHNYWLMGNYQECVQEFKFNTVAITVKT